MAFLVIAGFWAACGFVGGYIAAQKGRPVAEGAALGFLFGPIGALIEALMPAVANVEKPRKARRVPTVEYYREPEVSAEEDEAARWISG